MYYSSSGECAEICGDGKDLGMNECEDGNILDGDGCSSSCKIEPEFNCFRGTKTSPGYCTPVKRNITKIEVNSNYEVFIEF
jgi:cysteine-rich repeat protein